jgi:hypothetical protein
MKLFPPSPSSTVYLPAHNDASTTIYVFTFSTHVLDISVSRFRWLPVDFGYFTFPISYGSLVSSFCHYVSFCSCQLLSSLVVLHLLGSVCQPLQSVWLTSLWATRLTCFSVLQRQQGGIFILQRLQIDLYSTVAGGGFGGLGVSALAFGTQVRGFKPGRRRRIFQGEKILSAPSFGRVVKPWFPCR